MFVTKNWEVNSLAVISFVLELNQDIYSTFLQ